MSASRPVVSTAPSARTAASGSRCERAPRRARLDDHDRDLVRDDVVQLARDPRALGEHRGVLAPGALALELAGLLVETTAEVVARTQHAAKDERLRDRDRGREHGRVTRDRIRGR